MTHPTDDSLKPCPFCGGAAKVSVMRDESIWSHEIVPYTKVECEDCGIGTDYLCEGWERTAQEAWNTRALLAEQAQEPKAEDAPSDDELKDLAHSAYEEAMSFGLSVDTFLRYFKGIRNRAAIAAERKAP